jgi:hypothetical protein
MIIIAFRLLSAALGLVATLLALGGPFLFFSADLQQVDSAVVGGWLSVLFIAALFGLTAFVSFRYSVRGPRSSK